MTRTCWTLVLLSLALAACRSGAPAKFTTSPTPTTSSPSAAQLPPPPSALLRQWTEDTLNQAQQAAADQDVETFSACEAALVRKVDELLATFPASPELAQAVAELWQELDNLGATLAEEGGGEEEEAPPVPEELPVLPEEQVNQAAQAAGQLIFDLPVKVTPEVAAMIAFYTGPYRERLVAALERAARWLPLIRPQLKLRNLPQDLAYLPLVESAFQVHARSRARAMGLWQFMAGTARLYQLRCDGLVDERLDPQRATEAALDHLADLYTAFADWELALAAYNSGAGRVERAIRRAKGAKDFWSIRRFLPRETRNYVPALWAALIVVKQPQRFGLPTFVENPWCRERIEVEGALDLEVLAEKGGFELGRLRELNPALTRGITPPNGLYSVFVPCGEGTRAQQVIASIPAADRIKRLFHTVRAGDTLAALSRRYGVPVETIMAANGIKNPRSLQIGRELLIPKGAWNRAVVAQLPKGTKARAQTSHTAIRYRVKPGDTLYSIAREHGLSVATIQARNNLTGTVIRPGDILLLAP